MLRLKKLTVTTPPTRMDQTLLNPTGPYQALPDLPAPTSGVVQTQLRLLRSQGYIAVLQTRPVESEAWQEPTHGSAADPAEPYRTLPDPTEPCEQLG